VRRIIGEATALDKCDFISSSEGAMKCLGGITFPASKQQVLDWVEGSDGPEAVVVAANQIPDKMYESMDELLQYLAAGEPTKSE
jgi:hypothetical protein